MGGPSGPCRRNPQAEGCASSFLEVAVGSCGHNRNDPSGCGKYLRSDTEAYVACLESQVGDMEDHVSCLETQLESEVAVGSCGHNRNDPSGCGKYLRLDTEAYVACLE